MGSTLIGFLVVASALGAEESPLLKEKQIGELSIHVRPANEYDRPDHQYEKNFDDVLEIHHGNDILFRMMELTGLSIMETPKEFDFNKDGIEDLAVLSYSGGMHCCMDYVFIDLRGIIHEFARAHGGNQDSAEFERNSDHLILPLGDETFQYWYTSFAEFIAQSVDLYWDGHSLALDLNAMARPLPPKSELDGIAQEVRSEMIRGDHTDEGTRTSWTSNPWGAVPVMLWRTMLDLIYTGHPREADSFFNAAWPKSLPGKWAFYADFTKQLHSSPYWPQLCGWCAPRR